MPAKKRKILIVEDEESLRQVVSLKLAKEGYEVASASNGLQALDLMAKEKFDLALLDLVIPVKNGFTVLEELSARKDKTPVIVLTILNQEEDVKKAKKLGAIDYFIKHQTSINDLVDKIKGYIK